MRGLFFCDASYQGTASVVPNKAICELELQPPELGAPLNLPLVEWGFPLDH